MVLCLVQFVDVLGVTVVVAALPAMLAGLGASASATGPVATGYAMFFGGLLMLGARLGDRYGHRRVLLWGVAGFAVASLLAAVASSVMLLIAARCGQGAAAAMSVPTALRLITAVAGGERVRQRALAAWSGSGAVAGVAGYLVGGLLTDAVGWRAVFWVNLPLAAGLALAVIALVPALPKEEAAGLDAPGAALLTASVMAVVLGAALLESPDHRTSGLAALAVGVVLLTALVAVERRATAPLIPTTAVRNRRLRSGVAVAFVNTATTSSTLTLATFYLQQTRGLTASAAALWLLPCSVGVILGSALAAPLLRRRSPRLGMLLGLVLVAVGNGLLVALPGAPALLSVGVAIAGIGLGLSSVAANTLGTAVPAPLHGTASGALNTGAQLGTALGVSSLLLLAVSTRAADLPLAGMPLSWATAAALAVATAAVVGLRARRPVAVVSTR